MSFDDDRQRLSQFILNTGNKDLLEKIKNLVKAEGPDLWDELHDQVREDVEAAIKEVDAGKGISNSDVRKKYQKWLKK